MEPVTLEQCISEIIKPHNYPLLILYDDNTIVRSLIKEMGIDYEEESDIRANPQRKEELKTRKGPFSLVWIGRRIDQYLLETQEKLLKFGEMLMN